MAGCWVSNWAASKVCCSVAQLDAKTAGCLVWNWAASKVCCSVDGIIIATCIDYSVVAGVAYCVLATGWVQLLAFLLRTDTVRLVEKENGQQLCEDLKNKRE
jgi:hypothetical protein